MGYPEKRMIINRTDNRYIYLNRKLDIGYIKARIISKIRKKESIKNYNRNQGMFKPIYVSKNIDIIHTLNQTVSSNKPWVVSCEMCFPLYHPEMKENEKEKYYSKMKKYFLSSYCKKILPFSHYAKNVCLIDAKKYLSKSEYQSFKKKIQILYPPQKTYFNSAKIETKYKCIDKKHKLNFVFVGRQFFRKGGYIALVALKEIRKKYTNFNFIIISSLESDNKAYNQEYSKIKKEIQEESWIKWYKSVSNKKVISILKQCHVGLLPTFGDTFGFSVLEMQACGCPVITSNNYALPEINNEKIGWICDIQGSIKKYGKDYFNKSTCDNTTDLMIKNLTKIITNILEEDPKNIIYKAILSLNRVKKANSPDLYSKNLNEIFIDALK